MRRWRRRVVASRFRSSRVCHTAGIALLEPAWAASMTRQSSLLAISEGLNWCPHSQRAEQAAPSDIRRHCTRMCAPRTGTMCRGGAPSGALVAVLVVAMSALLGAPASAECHVSCLPRFGCTGSGADQCKPGVLLARTSRYEQGADWVGEDGVVQAAMVLPSGSAPIVGMDFDRRTTFGDSGMYLTVYAATADGSLWSVAVGVGEAAVEPPPVGVNIGSVNGFATALSARSIAADGNLYVTLSDGSVAVFSTKAGRASTVLTSDGSVTAAAATSVAGGDTHVYYGTNTGSIYRSGSPDGVDIVYTAPSSPPVEALSVDMASRSLTWATSSSLWKLSLDAHSPVELDSSLSATVAGVDSITKGHVESLGFVCDRSAQLVPADAVRFDDKVVEVSDDAKTNWAAATGITIENGDSFAGKGNGISLIGDVNGDDIGDLALGVPFDDVHNADSGSVIILTRSEDGQTVTAVQQITQADVDVSVANANFGYAVAGMNTETGLSGGGSLLAVGAPRSGDSGQVWILTVSDTDIIDSFSFDDTSGLTTGAMFGAALAAIDVTHDGMDELLVGVPRYNEGGTELGIVYVVHMDLTTFGAVTFTSFRQGQSDTHFGRSCAGASWPTAFDGSLLAIGARTFDESGAVELIEIDGTGSTLLSATLNSSSITMTNLGLVISPADHWGRSVGFVGDVDGDGRSELMVGAFAPTGVGYVDVLFLLDDGSDVRAGIRLNRAAGSPLPEDAKSAIVPEARWGASVARVSAASESVLQVAVAAENYDTKGAVFLLQFAEPPQLKFDDAVTVLPDNSANSWTLNSQDALTGVAAIDDVDGDGRPDLVCGAPNADYNGFVDSGAIFVVRRLGGGDATLLNTIAVVEHVEVGMNFGAAVAGLSDVDDDDVPEILVGAPGSDSSAGAIWVVHLSPQGEASQTIRIGNDDLEGSPLNNGDRFGSSVSVYYLEGDARPFVVVGAPMADSGGLNSGAVYLLSFTEDATLVEEYVVLTFSLPGDLFGTAVACPSVLSSTPMFAVGAPATEASGLNSGAVYLVLVESDPTQHAILSATSGGLDVAGDAPAAFDRFGSAISWLDDLDGNGGMELIVATGTTTDFRYAMLVFLNEDASEAIHTIRLDGTAASPLPTLVKADTTGASKWAAAIARVGSSAQGEPVSLAFSVPNYNSAGKGAVLLFDIEPRVRVTSVSDTGAGALQRSVREAPATLWRSGALAVVVRGCHAACAGDCSGPTQDTCDAAAGCAAGFVQAMPGSTVCCKSDRANVTFWWDGSSCVLHTACDSGAEYELHAPTTTSDRQCGACSQSCIPGGGCTGPEPQECKVMALVGDSSTMPRSLIWIFAGGSKRLAATLPSDVTGRIVGVDMDQRSPVLGDGVVALVGTSDGSVYSVYASPADDFSPREAAFVVNTGGLCVSMDMATARIDRFVYAVRADGSVVRVAIDDQQIEQLLPASLDVTAVAARVSVEGTTEVFYGTSGGIVASFDGTQSTPVASGLSAVSSLTVDKDSETLTWTTSDGELWTQAPLDDHAVRTSIDLRPQAVAVAAPDATSGAFAVEGSEGGASAADIVRFVSDYVFVLSAITQVAPLSSGDEFTGSGNGIAPIADVDGDGVPDVAVGRPESSSNSGSVVLLRATHDDEFAVLRVIDGSASPFGVGTGAQFGAALAGMADRDGDGVPELAIGVPGESIVLVAMLNNDGSAQISPLIIGSEQLQVSGQVFASNFGASLAAIDVDADGSEDLIAGAPNSDTALSVVYVIRLGLPSTSYVDHLKLSAASPPRSARFGASCAGTMWPSPNGTPLVVVSGDGHSTSTGAVYLLRFSWGAVPAVVSDVTLGGVDGDVAPSGLPITADSQWGVSTAFIGDLDGDGGPELLVGALASGLPFADVLFLDATANSVREGVRVGFSSPSLLPTQIQNSVSAGNLWFSSVARVGTTSDGAALLGIGVSDYDVQGFTGAGAMFVVRFVAPPTLMFADNVVELSTHTEDDSPGAWAPQGTLVADGRFGPIAPIDDVDGDGAADIVCGAAGAVPHQVLVLTSVGDGARLLNVIRGDDVVAVEPSTEVSEDARFGTSVTGLSDADGDGVPEIVVGAPYGEGGRGMVFVLRLASDGTVHAASVVSNDAMDGSPLSVGDFFGFSLAGLGLDSLGRPQIAVGAALADEAAPESGEVFIVWLTLGTVQYVSHMALSSMTGFNAISLSSVQFGYSLASQPLLGVGNDVLVAVGAPRSDAGGADTGTVYVLRMNVESNSISQVLKLDADLPSLAGTGFIPGSGSRFGTSAAWLEDLDNNGVGELLVGSFDNDYGTAHIVFLSEDLSSVVSMVRLSRDGLPLPSSARLRVAYAWGYSVAALPGIDGTARLAIGSPLDGAGAIFFLTIEPGVALKRFPDESTVDLGHTTTVAAVVSVASRLCSAACGGDCPSGTDSGNCSTATPCARGYVRAADGSGACCPDPGGSLATYYNDGCGVCHPTCAVCMGPGAGSCVPHRCADGHWWTGVRCLPHSPACLVDGEFEERPPTATSDRSCGQCASACFAGLGCTGPDVRDCNAAALIGQGASQLSWLLPDGTSVAAAVLPAAEDDEIVDIDIDPRTDPDSPGFVDAFVLTRECSIWIVPVSVEQARAGNVVEAGDIQLSGQVTPASVAQQCVALSVGDYASANTFVVARVDDTMIQLGVDASRYVSTQSNLLGGSGDQVTDVVVLPRDDDFTMLYTTLDGTIMHFTIDGGRSTLVRESAGSRFYALDATHAGLWTLECCNPDLGGNAAVAVGLFTQDTGDPYADVELGPVTLITADDDIGSLTTTSLSPEQTVSFVLDRSPPGLSQYPVAFASQVDEFSFATQGATGSVQWAPDPILVADNKFGSTGNGVALIDTAAEGVLFFAVGMPGEDTGRGAVVLLLSEEAGVNVKVQNMLNHGTVVGSETLSLTAGDEFGSSVAALDDWDDNGVPELAVGVPGASGGGRVDFFYMNGDGSASKRFSEQQAGIGSASTDRYGTSLSACPDVTGDGLKELIIGVSGKEVDGEDLRGAVLIMTLQPLEGTMAAFATLKIDESRPLWTPKHAVVGQAFGFSVSAVPAPGASAALAWLAVGMPGGGVGARGAVVLFSIADNGVPDAAQELGAVSGGVTSAGLSLEPDGRWGTAVSFLCDLDGDGIDELAVGSLISAPEKAFIDILFVESAMDVSSAVRVGSSPPLPVDMARRIADDSWWGASLGFLGVGSDGLPILAVGAANDESAAGAVFLLRLTSPSALRIGSDTTEFSLQTADVWGPTEAISSDDQFGAAGNSIAPLGDIDGDGVYEFGIGLLRQAGSGLGSLLVLHHTSEGDAELMRRITGSVGQSPLALSDGDEFGTSVAGIGRLAAAWTAVAVGAPGFNDGTGQVWILSLDETASLQGAVVIDDGAMYGNPLSDGDRFGAGMAAADVDNDGRNELLIGAALDDDAGTDNGAIYVVVLREFDAGYSSHTKFTAGTLGSGVLFHTHVRFASSIAASPVTAYSGVRVVAGAPGHSGAADSAGAVYIVYLSGATPVVQLLFGADASGLTATEGHEWGSSVAVVGDLDGNGQGDVAVGAAEPTSYGYISILLMSDDGSGIQSVVHLSPAQCASQVPYSIRVATHSGSQWGSSIAHTLTASDGRPVIAVAAPCPSCNPGFSAVHLFKFELSSRVRVVAFDQATGAPGSPTILINMPPAAQRVSAIAAVSHTCYAGCGGGCPAGDDPADCLESAGCAAGYALNRSVGACFKGPTDASAYTPPPVTTPPGTIDVPSAARGVAWTLGADGDEVAYVSASQGALVHGTSAQLLSIESDSDAAAVVWADVDANGYPDLLIAGARSANRIYMGPDLTSDEAGERNFGDDRPATYLSVADCDGDRDVDVYIAAPVGFDNLILLNNANGHFFESSPTSAALHDVDSGPHVWFDVNGDGDLDLVMSDLSDQSLYLLTNVGGCNFAVDTDALAAASQLLYPPLLDPTAATAISSMLLLGLSEVNYVSLLILQTRGPGVVVTLDDSEGSFIVRDVQVSETPNAVVSAASAGDVNHDGFHDVLLATSRGLRILSSPEADYTDITEETLIYAGHDAGVVSVASAAYFGAAQPSVVVMGGDDGARVLTLPQPSTLDTISVRIVHRRGLSSAAMFGSVVFALPQGAANSGYQYVETGALIKDSGGGGNVQISPLLRLGGLVNGTDYQIRAYLPNFNGGRSMVLKHVPVGAAVEFYDDIASPTLSATPQTGCVGIDESITITIAGLEAGTELSPTSSLNGILNEEGALSEMLTAGSGGDPELVYTVREGDPDWAANQLPLRLVLKDVNLDVDSEPTTWPPGELAACGDGTRPVAQFDSTPPDYTDESSASFRLTCSELGCRYKYSVDNGPWLAVSASVDDDDSLPADPADISLPPALQLLAAPPQRTNLTVAAFEVQLFGADVSVIEYKLDDGSGWVNTASATFEIPELEDGEHSILIRGGAADASPVAYDWEVDTVPPDVRIDLPPRPTVEFSGDGSSPPMTTAFVEADEPDCTFRYRVTSVAVDDSIMNDAGLVEAAVAAVAPPDTWISTEDDVLSLDLAYDAAHRLEVVAVDGAGNAGIIASHISAWPTCPPIPAVHIKTVHESRLGPVLTIETQARQIQTRFATNGTWGPWVTTESLRVRAVSSGVPLLEHAVEVRAYASCIPASGRPASAVYSWTEPEAPPELRAVIIDAPNPVTTLGTARFKFSAPGLAGDASFECAYAFAGLDSGHDPLYAGGGEDGLQPLWRPCTQLYTLTPLQVGRHALRVRIAGISAPEAEHHWTVQSSEDSAFTVTGSNTGLHTVQVMAIDAADNLQLTDFEQFEWEVDRTAPGTRAVLLTSSLSNKDTVDIEVECLGELSPEGCSFCWTSGTLPGGCSDAGVQVLTIGVPTGSDGVHVVAIVAVDGAGNRATSAVSVEFTVDRFAPTTVASLLHGGAVEDDEDILWLVNSTEVEVQFETSEPVLTVTLLVNGFPVEEIPAASDAGLVFSARLELATAAAHSRVTFLSVDAAGNHGPQTSPATVILDTVAPTVTILDPPSTYSSALQIEFEVDPVDASERMSAYLSVLTSAVGETRRERHAVRDFGARGTAATVNVKFTDLDDVAYTAEVFGEDAAGNVGPGSVVEFAIDRTAPETVVDATELFTNRSTVVVGVHCAGELRPQNCSYCWQLSVGAPTCDVLDGNKLTIAIPEGEAFDGVNSATVVATDVAGNEDASPAHILITVDRVPPVVTPSMVTGGRVPNAGGSLWLVPGSSLVAAATGSELLAVVHVNVLGFASSSSTAQLLPVAGPSNVTQGTVSLPSELVDGDAATLAFTGVDLAGNYGDAEFIDVIVDGVAPEVRIVEPSHVGAVLGNSSMSFVVASVDASERVAEYRLSYGLAEDGPPSTTQIETVSPIGATGESAMAQLHLSALVDGLYVLQFSAVDLAGNEGPPLSLAVRIDTIAPTGSFILPQPLISSTLSTLFRIGVVDASTVSVVVQVGDMEPITYYAPPTTDSSSLNALDFNVEVTEDGMYPVQVNLTDAANNTMLSPLTLELVVDTTAPVVQFYPSITTAFTRLATFTVGIECVDDTLCSVDLSQDGFQIHEQSLSAGEVTTIAVHAADEGEHVVMASSIDAAGNPGSPNAYSWTLDLTAPQLQRSAWATVDLDDDDIDQAWVETVSVLPNWSDGADVDVLAPGVSRLSQLLMAASCVDVSDCVVVATITQLQRSAGSECEVAPSSTPGASTDEQRSGTGELVWGARGLEDGYWSLNVAVSDVAGNVDNSSAPFEWWVDTTKPSQPTISHALPESHVTAEQSIVVDVSLIDASPFLEDGSILATVVGETAFEVDFIVDNGVIEARIGVGDVPDSILPGELPDGRHTLTVAYIDAAGNAGAEAVLDWTVQSREPDTLIVEQPATEVGVDVVGIVVAAVELESREILDGSFVQVSVNSGEWTDLCVDAESEGRLRNDGLCEYHLEMTQGIIYNLQFRAVNGVGRPDPTPAILVTRYKVCTPAAQYAVIDTNTSTIECRECPSGADCSRTNVQQHALQAQSGFWRPPGASPSKFYQCPRDGACIGEREGPDGTMLPSGCAQGYTGLLCSWCDDGYYDEWGKCAPCPETSESVAGTIVGISFAMCIVIAVVFKYRSMLPRGIMRIALAFGQVCCTAELRVNCCVFGDTVSASQIVGSANSAYTIPWPQVFIDVIAMFKLML